MGINDNAIPYNGLLYQVAVIGREAVWVVTDANERVIGDGAITDGTLEAAEQSAKDFIDQYVPEVEPEIAENEASGFSGDYTNSTCKAQSRNWNQDFIVLSSDGYFLQDNVKGDILNLDANDMIDMTMPQGYKMKVQIAFKGQEDYGLGVRQKTYDSATLYLEGGDFLSVSIRSDEVVTTLFQNGSEKINADNLRDYNATLVRKAVTLRMVSFEICTMKQDDDDDFVQDEDDSTGFSLDNDMLLFVLGGLVLLIIAGYVINTTSEVMGDG
jgi:hypothetical protein